MKQENIKDSVIPGLTRNPVVHTWIPAFAGMTRLKNEFNVTGVSA